MAFGAVRLVYNEPLLTTYLQTLMIKYCEGCVIELCAVRKVGYYHVPV
jgi:hypothetical protein